MTAGNRFSVEVNGAAVVAHLQGLGDRLHSSLYSAVVALSVRLQAMVMNKLSGPVLHVRTGTLRRSINRVVIDAPTAIVGQVGTNVAYAARHEYGFQGIEHVREYTRRVFGPEKQVLRGRKHGENDIRQWVSHRDVEGSVIVHAHDRIANTPERSFLRSSLSDMSGDIRAEIKRAAHDALRAA